MRFFSKNRDIILIDCIISIKYTVCTVSFFPFDNDTGTIDKRIWDEARSHSFAEQAKLHVLPPSTLYCSVLLE
jgi:hypothetical protein